MEDKPSGAPKAQPEVKPSASAERPLHHYAEENRGLSAAQLVAFCRRHGVTVTTPMTAEKFDDLLQVFLHGRL